MLRHAIDFRSLSEQQSAIFSVTSGGQSPVRHLPDPKKETGFTDQELEEILKPVDGGRVLVVGIIDAVLDGGFYLRRLSDNRAVISVDEVAQALEARRCSLESFILRNVYQLAVTYCNFNGVIPLSPGATGGIKLSHDEVRKCIFDFNVNKFDVVSSLNKPILCQPCRDSIRNPQLRNLLPRLDKELKAIRKPLFFRAADFVANHPILSLLITLLSGLILNVAANFIYDFVK